MLPDGWRVYRFGEIASFKNGLNFTKSDAGEAVKIVGVGDFQDRSSLEDTASLATVRVANRVRDAELLEDGDLLFVRSNGNKALIGRCLYFPRVRERLAFSGFTIRARVDRSVLTPEFAAYLARSEAVGGHFHENGSGTNISNLSQETLSDVSVNVPPLKEQRRIAQVLACWDEAIATTERLLVNSRRQKQALLAHTLRLPLAGTAASRSRGGSAFPASVQSGIPNLPHTPSGWRRSDLREHLREVRRPVILDAKQMYRLVTVKRSRGGVVLREVLSGNDIKTPTQFQVRAGDFLISKRQIVHGACGIVPAELDGAIVSNEYAVLNTDDEIDIQFLRHLSESIYFQQTCFHSSIGVHVEKMIFNTERWLSCPFNIPPIGEQRRIAEVLGASTDDIACLERQVEALKAEKRALMASLLTGKRRLPLPEPEAKAAA